METTEKIVEAWARYVKGWATIPNVRCPGQNEIDLIAIDPVSLERYHIETSISISPGFGKLTAKPYDPEKAKQRVHQASQRRTIGFFVERKFNPKGVVECLEKMGFKPGNYQRLIVTLGWEETAEIMAKAADIKLVDFGVIVREIAGKIRGSREYFGDDTLRTLNLFIYASEEAERDKGKRLQRTAPLLTPPHQKTAAPSETGSRFWVYENWTHEKAIVHRASCSFCQDGNGMHASKGGDNGQWLGPFSTAAEAWNRAERTQRRSVNRCSNCTPAD